MFCRSVFARAGGPSSSEATLLHPASGGWGPLALAGRACGVCGGVESDFFFFF